MATSGEKQWKVSETGSVKSQYQTFKWERTSYSVTDNTSTIYWELWVEIQGWYSDTTKTYTVSVDGNTYSKTVTIPAYENTLVVTGTTVVSHDTKGAKTFTVTVNNNSTTFDLNMIPRPATISSAPNFNDEEDPRVNLSNLGWTKPDKIEVCISFTGVKDDIPYRNIYSITDSYYQFRLTDEERAILRQGITSGDNRTVRFYVKSTIGSETFWDYTTKTLTLINHTPTLSPTVKDVNARTLELTGNNQTLIKYFSNAEFNTGATARKEAQLENQYVKNGDTIVNTSTGTIEGVTSNTFYFSATDTRGFSTREALVFSIDNKKFIEYVKLTCSLKTEELTANGNLTFTISGKYFNGSFGAKNNSLEVEYSVVDDYGDPVFNSEGSGWVVLGTVAPTVDSENNYTYSYTISGLNHEKKYTLTVNVIDELSPVQTVVKVLATIPIFDWGKDDFKHYTNVYLENNKTLRTNFVDGTDAQILGVNTNNNLTIGWGGYDTEKGDTGIYGNNVRIHTKDKLYINGREFNTNKVLWESTGWYMNGGQMVTLKEAISAQPNGIVLVFSLYDTTSNTSSDVSINTFFVSKKEVELLPNAPHTFFMMINSGFSVIGAKYLYIDDTTITGHDTNSASGSNNNLTFANNRFVLRYVIGV